MCLKMLRVAVVLLWSFPAWTQESGIQFHKNAPWATLLAKAKAEDKLLFVDAYTTWCGPCKWMETNVFAHEEVSKFYNAHFINVKIDLEKGEGLELARTYHIRAYPAFLFVDGDGNAIHQAVGSKEVSRFLNIGRTAIDPEKCFAGLEKRLDAGDRNPQFISRLQQVFSDAMHPRAQEVIELYLQMQTDWNTPEIIRLIAATTQNTHSKQFNYLIKNRSAFEKEIGKRAYLNMVQGIVLKEAFGNLETPPLDSIQPVLEAKLPSALAAQLFSGMQMNHYLYKKEIQKYCVAAIAYYNAYPSNDLQELNGIAWTFYEQVENKVQLKAALKWAQQSVNLNSFSFNNDTLAALYYKLGDKVNAKKTAEKAITLAKANKEDSAATQELLEKINKMK